jgi:hypothetical protein
VKGTSGSITVSIYVIELISADTKSIHSMQLSCHNHSLRHSAYSVTPWVLSRMVCNVLKWSSRRVICGYDGMLKFSCWLFEEYFIGCNKLISRLMRNKRSAHPIWKILLSRKVHILYFNRTRKTNKNGGKLAGYQVIKNRCHRVMKQTV